MIEEFMLGNTKVKLHSPEIPKKESLKNLYDVVNEIGMSLQTSGINISKMFYTKEQVNNLKTKKGYIFIK